MSLDLNRKTITKNAYRITKVRNKTALRLRVPGGHLDARYLALIQNIAEQYGNGTVHLTTRQGFEVPGIDYNDIPEINKKIKPLLEGIEMTAGVNLPGTESGYPSAGTRNISACIGNRVCPFANADTTGLALRLEKEVYPHDYHVKIAITGCPNDCIKAHLHDFGVICQTEPQYDTDSCISCEACVKVCKQFVTGALTMVNGRIKRDEQLCIGCGECILKCPTSAWTRNPKKFYRLIIMGRTGKRNPRLATTFLTWAEESVIVNVIKNTYAYIDQYINKSLPKEHVGYIFDRTGYAVFKDAVLKDTPLNPEAHIAESIRFSGYEYEHGSGRPA